MPSTLRLSNDEHQRLERRAETEGDLDTGLLGTPAEIGNGLLGMVRECLQCR